MAQDEENTLARLKSHRAELIDLKIAEHRGRIVKTTGDGLLAEFASAVDAVRCATDVQRGMTGREAKLAEDHRIRFRIGINVGDVIIDANDLYGDGVNIAARLETLAEPGSVFISRTVHDQVRDRLDLTFDDLGERELKNIPRPVRVYRVVLDGSPTPGRVAEPLALPDRPSIAVLPFTNISGDPEQEYFADGMVEDIITALARLKWLFVIARNSSFTYKGRAVDIKQVARELGVRYVLEGSVRKAGGRVRITGQLIDATNGAHLWADRFDGSLADIFDLQDQVTASVVGAIEPSLRQAEIERSRRKRPENLDAYDYYLRALPHAYANMPGESSEAIRLLGDVLRIDPHYAAAHGIKAWCHEQRFSREGQREDDRVAAIEHARAAITYGTDDAAALAHAGFVLFIVGRDIDAAQNTLARALVANPNSALAHMKQGIVHAFLGNAAPAIEHSQTALRLSPFDSMSNEPKLALAIVHLFAGRYDDAISWASQSVQANPRFSIPYTVLVAAYVKAGRTTEARATIERLREILPGCTMQTFQIWNILGAERSATILSALKDAGLPE